MIGIPIILIGGLVWWFLFRKSGPPVEHEAYSETFNEAGTWTVGDDATASGAVREGLYEMSIEISGDIFWVTGGRNFSDAIYEVAATPVEGTIDNGYGMLFRVDSEENTFYIFKVSSDGYVYIGRCEESCVSPVVLVDQDWFASDAVQQGLNVTNILRVEANGPDMIFSVNDTEVGRATDKEISHGDIGLVAETFAPGGFRVDFDNFSVTPLNGN
ncbi:MAG: hypothetical protein WAM60_14040 [Candidatus Promineifilaceae bacterium]